MAADLPKEGTYSGTYSAFATVKATAIGKDRLLVAFDENGLSVTNGFTDHMTWHCFGLQDVTKGMAEFHVSCVGTDPDGDQLVGNGGSDGKFAADTKNPIAKIMWTTGTGKYVGVSGGHTFVSRSPEFRAAAEGTYFQYGTYQGSYKLP